MGPVHAMPVCIVYNTLAPDLIQELLFTQSATVRTSYTLHETFLEIEPGLNLWQIAKMMEKV